MTIKIDVLPVGVLATNCYVVGFPESPLCVVVDPGSEADRIIDFLHENDLALATIISTHAHADHTGAAAGLVDRYEPEFIIGSADAGMAAAQSPWLTEMLGDFVDPPAPTQLVRGGEILRFDGFAIEVLATPGHTPGSISLKLDDRVFTGDTLFRESIGRFDLDGGNQMTELASIRKVLFSLDDTTRVLPGHGPATTIGYEKVNNPYF